METFPTLSTKQIAYIITNGTVETKWLIGTRTNQELGNRAMAHSLTPAPAATARASTPFSTTSKSNAKRIARFPSSATALRGVGASLQSPNADTCHDDKIVNRRTLSLGLLGGALVGLNDGEQSARAAGRRPPPPAPVEKKDPNVSGVQAKVLASKRRKEAMKEEMAKLRQKGKSIQQTPPPPLPSSSQEAPSE